MDLPALGGRGAGWAISAGLRTGGEFAEKISNIEGNTQQAAINLENARKVHEEYTKSMKPIYTDELAQNLPQYMRSSFSKLAQLDGIVEMDGERSFIRAGKMKEFMTDFKTNKIKQAIVLDQGNKEIDVAIEPMMKRHAQHKKVVSENMASYQQKLKDAEAARWDEKTKTMRALDMGVVNKITADRDKFIQTSPDLKKMQELEGVVTKLTKEKHNMVAGLGIIDEEHKKNVDDFSLETALKISHGFTTREDELRKLQRIKSEGLWAVKKATQDTPEEMQEKAFNKTAGSQKAKLAYPLPTKPDKPRKDETPEGQIDKKIKGLESHIKINYDTKVKENEKKLKELEVKRKTIDTNDPVITKEEHARDKATLEGNIERHLAEKQKTVDYINELRSAGEPQPYKKGAIVAGKDGNYRFKGGNWKDKKSWVKVP